MYMVCLEPCKIQKRQTSGANKPQDRAHPKGLEGLPYAVSAPWTERGNWAAFRDGVTGKSVSPVVTSGLDKQVPPQHSGSGSPLHHGSDFLRTLRGEASCLPSYHEFPWAKKLSEPHSLWGQPFRAVANSFPLSDFDFVTFSTRTVMV